MTVQILHGDCRDMLKTLPDASVHCCVTSPPYFGLRDYGVDGQIGLEPSPDAFVAELVAVFREVRRVLRDDGTLWLNLGDSYAGSWGAQSRGGPPSASSTLKGNGHVGGGPKLGGLSAVQIAAHPKGTRTGSIPVGSGLKPKDLIGIPWRVAFALQADGWWLRQDVIWSKPNPMPESVRDRCTKAHEYLFLLSKSERYYWNAEAMQEPVESDKGNANSFRGGAYINNATFDNSEGGKRTVTGNTRSKRDSFKRDGSKREQAIPGQAVGTHRPDRKESEWPLGTRNKRSVWTVATEPFKEAHFATFPPALIEPCIAAGCPLGGVVLDPFGGAGTTGLVADRLQRDAILIELNPAYAGIAERRITGDAPLFAEVTGAPA
jgi:site-specific DNA-methyltransferase (adenine-specific)